jgi:formate-dependent phosphoribosylglycinamide formyltransferase (GAR transformylase)
LSSPQPSVLIVAAQWWPLSARLASALIRHGCRVSALCPAGHPLRRVLGVERIRRYDGLRSFACLRSVIKAERPDIIVPCDDGVVSQLHVLHAAEPAAREVIERSLGAPRSFSVVASRYRLLDAARKLGIAVPETRRILGPEDLAAWHESVAPAGVLKIDAKSAGNGVRMCFSIEESLAAWREFIAARGFATALKRLS